MGEPRSLSGEFDTVVQLLLLVMTVIGLPGVRFLADLKNCTKFGQLILSKIIKTVAISCQISRLKCTKFDFGWGSTPDPAGAAYSAKQTSHHT